MNKKISIIILLLFISCVGKKSDKMTEATPHPVPTFMSQEEEWRELAKGAKIHPCHLSSKVPLVKPGCTGEYCGVVFYDFSISKFDLFERPDEKSRVIAVIEKCKPLGEVESFIITRKLGEALVLKEGPAFKKLGVKKGDVVYLERYGVNGYDVLCIGDQSVFSRTAPEGEENGDHAVFQPGIVEEWVKITLPKTAPGWSLKSKAGIMWYQDRDESLKCSSDHTLR